MSEVELRFPFRQDPSIGLRVDVGAVISISTPGGGQAMRIRVTEVDEDADGLRIRGVQEDALSPSEPPVDERLICVGGPMAGRLVAASASANRIVMDEEPGMAYYRVPAARTAWRSTWETAKNGEPVPDEAPSRVWLWGQDPQEADTEERPGP